MSDVEGFHQCVRCQKWHFQNAPHLPEQSIEDSEWSEVFWMFGFPYAHPASSAASLRLVREESEKINENNRNAKSRKWTYCTESLPIGKGFVQWETQFGQKWIGYYCDTTGYWLGRCTDILGYNEYMCETRVVVRWKILNNDSDEIKKEKQKREESHATST